LPPLAAAVKDRRSSVSGHGGEYSGPRPPHGASAATTSNGPCDHTRAMPRPVANIVRVCVCVTLRTELATFGRKAAALPLYLHGLALEDGEVVGCGQRRAGSIPLIMARTWERPGDHWWLSSAVFWALTEQPRNMLPAPVPAAAGRMQTLNYAPSTLNRSCSASSLSSRAWSMRLVTELASWRSRMHLASVNADVMAYSRPRAMNARTQVPVWE
jgi:hypothetical protein